MEHTWSWACRVASSRGGAPFLGHPPRSAVGQAQAASPIHSRRRGTRAQLGSGRDGAPADPLAGRELPG
eukprot:7476535-Alexandrium_andersonii.AAC.1